MIICSVGVIEQNGYVLAVSRKDDDTDFGLVGGKVEENETPEQGLCREILEETGISAIKYKLIGCRNVDNKKVFIYKVIDWVGVPMQMEENSIVKWLTKEEMCLQKTFGEFNKKTFEML